MLIKCKNQILAVAAAMVMALIGSPLLAGEKQPSGDKVALVNGSAITQADFDREINRVRQQFLRSGKPLNESQLAEIKKEVLESLINGELLYQQSQKQGIKITDADVGEELTRLKKRFPDETEFKNALSKANLSEADVRFQIEKGKAIQKFIDMQFVQKITVPDEEIRAYYDSNPDFFKQPEQVRASHILIKVDPKADKSKKKAARKKLKKVQQMLKSGEDFAALAREFSEGPSGANGGDLGYFGRGQMVKPFEEEAFSLKPGEVSDIVETKFGYHLIKVVDKKPASTVAYEKVKEQLDSYLKQQKVQQEVSSYVEELKGKSEVERFLPTDKR